MILDKAKMAHEYAMKHLGSLEEDCPKVLAIKAWQYVDAMQAEADKRVVKLPDVFFDTKANEEFQPDFSNTPKDAIAYKIVDGIVQYLHGTRSSDGTLCGGYLANDGWIKLEKRS